MQCPRCNEKDTRVVDSRLGKNGRSIRRRRLCGKCGARFNTIEEILREDIVVIKSDGRREEFDRNKISAGIRRACQKRPVDIDQIDMIISDLLVELEQEFGNEFPTKAIGERVMQKLKGIDQIAYVRFASVYKDFRDISELVDEISTLNRG